MSKLYYVREQIGLLRNSTFQRCLSTTCSGSRSMIITRTPVMSVCREINLLHSRNISFQARYVLFPFRWLSMLSSHLSLGLPRGLFPFILKFITTLTIDYSSPVAYTGGFLVARNPTPPTRLFLIFPNDTLILATTFNSHLNVWLGNPPETNSGYATALLMTIVVRSCCLLEQWVAYYSVGTGLRFSFWLAPPWITIYHLHTCQPSVISTESPSFWHGWKPPSWRRTSPSFEDHFEI